MTAGLKVTRVCGEVLFGLTRSAADLPRTVAGYRYIAVLEDESSVVIWTNATLQYAWAYQWSGRGARGKSKKLTACFTYSNFPVTSPGALARFRIEWI